MKLTVTDNASATGSVTKSITVGTTTNQPPKPAFTQTCQRVWFWRYCDFNASGSTDPDGTIASYAWDFGDGSTGAGVTVRHFYGSAGTKSVKLTVTDNLGATASLTKAVTVP